MPGNRWKTYVKGADRDKLDPILDACVEVYVNQLDEDSQGQSQGFRAQLRFPWSDFDLWCPVLIVI